MLKSRLTLTVNQLKLLKTAIRRENEDCNLRGQGKCHTFIQKTTNQVENRDINRLIFGLPQGAYFLYGYEFYQMLVLVRIRLANYRRI